MNEYVNIPLLRKAVEWVEEQAAQPDQGQWHQGAWVLPNYRECGTAYCVAGYVGALVDERYATSSNGWLVDEAGDELVDEKGDWLPHVSVVAREALSLTPDDADRLFDARNSAERIRLVAEGIAGEPL